MLLKLNKRSLANLPASTKRLDVRDAELHGFILRLYPTGKRTWFYQYRAADGQHTRIKLGDSPGLSPDAARQMAMDHMIAVRKGANPVKERRAAKLAHSIDRASTLAAFLDDHYEPWSKAHLKDFTAQLDRIRSDFKDWLPKPLASIDPPSIEARRREWRATLAARTVNRDMERLQSVMSRAVEWGALAVSPFKGLKKLKTDKGGRLRFLSTDEESRLRAALSARGVELQAARDRFNAHRAARHREPLPAKDDYLKAMVLTALNTGMRRGELLSLRWGDVDLDAKVVTVIGTSSKTGQTRHIPLNAEALAVLGARKGESVPTDLVFAGHDGRRMSQINNAWRTLSAAAGLVAFRFHDLRHTFASRLVQAGVDLNTVRELLGHTDIAMTLRYAHLAPQNLRAAVEMLGVP